MELKTILISSTDSHSFNNQLKSAVGGIDPGDLIDIKFSTCPNGVNNYETVFSAVIIFKVG